MGNARKENKQRCVYVCVCVCDTERGNGYLVLCGKYFFAYYFVCLHTVQSTIRKHTHTHNIHTCVCHTKNVCVRATFAYVSALLSAVYAQSFSSKWGNVRQKINNGEEVNCFRTVKNDIFPHHLTVHFLFLPFFQDFFVDNSTFTEKERERERE